MVFMLAPILINILISVALSVGASLLQQALKGPEQQPKRAGVRGSVTIGGDEPLSFIMGRYGTAGHLEYAGTWGDVGGTPNAYLTHVISLSDMPVRGLSRLFVNGAAVTLAGSPTGDLGYAVTEFTVDGTAHLWVKFYDGSQTTADPLLLAAFGADPDRPWQSDMIGRGLAYAVVTALVNRELFPGFPEYFFEVDGVALDDPRTGTANDNPVVMIHQVLSGISYGGTWIWGPQGIPATRLPSANWEAQMDKCDLPIALVGGGTEPQFRAGAEVRVDQQPIDVIAELLNSCSGRIAEVGGIYKVLVGAPDAAVVSFTDEDIVITEGQSFEPFPGLESTFNGVNATYAEPAEKWGMKEAPAIRNTALEADDDDRRLPASLSFPMVYSGTQAQRLMQAMHLEDRRFRNHTMTMPPEFWEYEVLDAASWSSDRNGYEDKVFLITVMDDLPNGNQFMGFKEQDPTDYDWDEGTDEQPYDTVPLVITRPPPQLMTGWTAIPATIKDNAGNDRRPSIEVGWEGGLDDIQSVRIQARLAGETALVYDGSALYDKADPSPSRVLNAVFLPLTDYEVRGKFIPFGPRVTRWSNQDEDGTEGPWLGVTTDDIRFGTDDFYPLDLSALGDQVNDALAWLGKGVRGLSLATQRLAQLQAEQDLANFTDRQTLYRELRSVTDNATATFEELITVATGPGSALAESITSLYVAMGGNEAAVNVRFSAEAGPSGYSARYGVQVAVDDEAYRSAAFYLDAPSSPLDPTRFVMVADQTVVTDSLGNVAAVFQAGTSYFATARIQDASITTAKIADANITSAKIADLAVDTIKIANAAVTALVTTTGANKGSGNWNGVALTSLAINSGVFPFFLAAEVTVQQTSGGFDADITVGLALAVTGGSAVLGYTVANSSASQPLLAGSGATTVLRYVWIVWPYTGGTVTYTLSTTLSYTGNSPTYTITSPKLVAAYPQK